VKQKGFSSESGKINSYNINVGSGIFNSVAEKISFSVVFTRGKNYGKKRFGSAWSGI
jgi:hypothetical protein